MNVVVTAGGRPSPDDPLYPWAHGEPKALLDIAGKPMVQWVLDALNEARAVGRIVLVGLPPQTWLSSRRPLEILPDQGEMLANIQAGAHHLAQLDPSSTHFLVCSSDIPALRGEMVDWLIEHVQQSGADLSYTVIQRQVMEARFPQSRRTYVRLKEGEFCGGDLNAVSLTLALGEHPFTRRLIEARKNPLRQAAMVGFDTLIFLLLGQLNLSQAARRVSRRLGINGQALPCPYAEIGMDVDKPFQLELLRADLSHR